MGRLTRLLLIFLGFSTPFYSILVNGETYSVWIGTNQYVNVVSKNFLSFTVDPKYLFSSSEKYGSNECVCMASSLTPAYLRIAGPSTAHMTFKNTTITIDNNTENQPRKILSHLRRKNKKKQAVEKLQIGSDQWKRFATWAKATGFDIVFALNNGERTKSGMWDPQSTLDILSVAEKAGIIDVFWQLGYECANQSIDDYLNDLQSLRVLTETFPAGWRAGGGDVTRCLRERSSDFKDYVTLAVDMADAVLLNGNSSAHELDRLSATDRIRLLKLLHTSSTPLWITEHLQQDNELARAADWMASLGFSARNGFAAHFRELSEEELYKPTLSFYMALLFKNLVGERVLAVDLDSTQALLFAHCASLRRQSLPGAVALYGVNMDDEPARLSVKLTKREEGGDILQFILSQDEDGNTIVNGRVMSQEGDIRPVVKRVGAYKTLLINLPPKSFGFWVIANTKAEACRDFKDTKGKLLEALPVEVVVNKDLNKDDDGDIRKARSKRSLNTEGLTVINADITNNAEDNKSDLENKEWNDKVEDLNNYLKDVHRFLRKKPVARTKRQMPLENQTTHKLKRQLFKIRKDLKLTDEERKPILNFVDNLLQLTRKNGARYADRIRHSLKGHTSKFGHRSNHVKDQNSESGSKKLSRSRRSVDEKYHSQYKDEEDFDKDNEIEVEDKENRKLWRLLHNVQKQLEMMKEDNTEKSQDSEKDDTIIDQKTESDKVVVKTEISDDSANINLIEKPNHGLLKATFEKLFSTLSELNTNLSRFWEAFSFFE